MLVVRIYRTDTIIFVCTCPYHMAQEKYVSTFSLKQREFSFSSKWGYTNNRTIIMNSRNT